MTIRFLLSLAGVQGSVSMTCGDIRRCCPGGRRRRGRGHRGGRPGDRRASRRRRRQGNPEETNELTRRVAAVAEFLRRRLTGDYAVDEFSFDPHFTDAVAMPLLRTLFRSWFRVDVSGVENLPADRGALVVANMPGCCRSTG